MKKRKTVGYGFVGEWCDGKLGWFMPAHVRSVPKSGFRKGQIEPPASNPNCKGTKAYLCKITIEEVHAKDGRRIVRIFK